MTTSESGDGPFASDLTSDIESLQWDFHHHPLTYAQAEDQMAVRDAIGKAGMAVLARCPRGRERSVARTKLEEALMWAEASIERDGEDKDADGGVVTRPGGGSRGSRKDRVESARENIRVDRPDKGIAKK